MVRAMAFPVLVWMWELDHKEGWAPKNWCFQTVVLEKTLESPLDSKEIKPVDSKGNPTLTIHWKDWCWSWSYNTSATWCEVSTHWKRPIRVFSAGTDWGQEEKGVTEDEMAWWHHRLSGHVFEQTLGDKWRTGKPGTVESLGLQRVRHDLATAQQQLKDNCFTILYWFLPFINMTQQLSNKAFEIWYAFYTHNISHQSHFKCSVATCDQWLPYNTVWLSSMAVRVSGWKVRSWDKMSSRNREAWQLGHPRVYQSL